jgi:hypothetical protein
MSAPCRPYFTALARPWACFAAAALLVMSSAGALADDAPRAPAVAAPDKAATSSHPVKRPLDLSAPPMNHILTPQQLQALTEDQDDGPPPEEVSVDSPRYVEPVPAGGAFVAIPWALLHPLQAWRIFTPITD